MKKIILFLLLPLQLFAQDNTELIHYIDSLTTPLNKIDAPGAVLLVAKDGKPIYRKAYGMASLEFGVPTRPDHRFCIGSVSKQFCAIAILQLASQGKLNLQDDIRKYLPEFNTHGRLITIEHLITHTSGIPSTENRDYADLMYTTNSMSNKDVLDYAMQKDLLFEPGTDFSYNNIGFTMAAIIAERVSGMSYREYLEKNIFQPAGMVNTFLPVETIPLYNLATSYQKNAEGKWIKYSADKWTDSKGRGGIISTIDDLLLWYKALLEEKVLSKEWIEKAWKSFTLKDGRSTNYGFGWRVQQFNGYRIVSHGGAKFGYRTGSYYIPEKNIYIAYANFFEANPDILPAKIIWKLLEQEAPTPSKQPTLPLNDYEGVYKMHSMGARLVTQMSDGPMYHYITYQNDSLFMQNTGGTKIYMRPYVKDVFMPAGNDIVAYYFKRNESGKVIAIYSKGFVTNTGPITDEPKVNQSMNEEPAPVNMSSDITKKYIGTYYNVVLDEFKKIEFKNNKLFLMDAGEAIELIPLSENRFALKSICNSFMEFNLNNKKEIILKTTDIRTWEYKRVSDF